MLLAVVTSALAAPASPITLTSSLPPCTDFPDALIPLFVLLVAALVLLYRRHSRISRDNANLRISRDRANLDLQMSVHVNEVMQRSFREELSDRSSSQKECEAQGTEDDPASNRSDEPGRSPRLTARLIPRPTVRGIAPTGPAIEFHRPLGGRAAGGHAQGAASAAVQLGRVSRAAASCH